MYRKRTQRTAVLGALTVLLQACTYSMSWSTGSMYSAGRTLSAATSVPDGAASGVSREPTVAAVPARSRTAKRRDEASTSGASPARVANSGDAHESRATQEPGARDRAPAETRANPRVSDGGHGEAACYASLRSAGVSFQNIAKPKATGIAWPIKLDSPLAGIEVRGGQPNAPTSYLDCRLAQALLAWAPALRRAGVVGLRHYSMFRKDARVAGTSKVSGHAHGVAIDVAEFELRDGRELSVLDDWNNRGRGEDPCMARTSDSDATRLMRGLVCNASAADLFQTVITPHYNDAHRNHVHLEIDPDDDGRFIG